MSLPRTVIARTNIVLTKSSINVAVGFLVVLATLFLGPGCSSNESNPVSPPPSPPPGTTANISINNLAFTPSSQTIAAGTTVIWTNNESMNHTVTSDAGNELQSGLLSQGRTYSHTFNDTGVFPYHRTVHSTMTGTVTVQP